MTTKTPKIKNSYKKEIKEELKNNSIVLSFAISIIIIGIITIFYKNSETLLIGIAISSILLTIIQCFSNGNTLLNILPLITLLIFGFFPKTIENIPGINVLLNKDFYYIIVFFAFSISFLTQAYKNIIFRYKVNQSILNNNNEKNKVIYNQLKIMKNIKNRVNDIKKVIEKKNVTDENITKSLEELESYVENESFISNVKSTLITKGNEDEKDKFAIEEIEESIILNSALARTREINAKDKPQPEGE